jgi:hypothetical protein
MEEAMPGTLTMKWVPLLVVCIAATAEAQVKIASNKPVILRDGAGAAPFTLANTGEKAVPLSLTAGIFTDETSQANVPASKVAFGLEAGGGPLPKQIDAGQSLQIVATVSNLAESNAADAKVFNQSVEVGTLTAVADDIPLNITLDGDGTTEKRLAFAYGVPAVITLKNGGKEFLTLDWRLLIDGKDQKDPKDLKPIDTVTIAPNGHARIVVRPHPDVYTWKDSFRPSARNGVLLLRLHNPQGVPKELLPSQVVPVSLTMMRRNPDTTGVLFALYVMFFLLVGGALSLLGSSVLPNMLRKASLRKQIGDLANRTSGVSTRVDSYLRVLLRLERKKIDIALDEVGALSLSTLERFDDVGMAIDRLSKRLTVAERLDDMWSRFEDACTTAPPSITDQLDRILQMASRRLNSFALSDDDVSNANGFLDKAGVSLAMLDDADAQSKLIAANFKQLQDRLTSFPEEYYKDLEAALPGIFDVLKSPFNDPKSIVRPMFFAVDHAIAAVQVALDYSMVRATVPAGDPASCDAQGKTAKQRLLEREFELINLLGTLSWKSLRAATTLVQQMREGIYEEDILREIGKTRANGEKPVKVVFDTQKARPYHPVYFSISFDDPRFKGAAALNGLAFRWSFPGDLSEEGPKVCHYFQGDEHHGIKPREEDPEPEKQRRKSLKKRGPNGMVIRRIPIAITVHSQRNLEVSDTLQGVIDLTRSKPHRSSRAFAEGVRFLITFGVALAGLEAGALDQLAKLDFLPATIAVVALGFGADSIKNLLTQAPKKTG